MPQLKHRNYLVEYSTDPEAPVATITFEVRVITADVLEAERTAPSYGITGADHPIALNTMWIWAAARRLGHVGKVGWPDFQRNLIDWEATKAEAPVPPTSASDDGASTSAPTASEASTSTGGSPSPQTPTSSHS